MKIATLTKGVIALLVYPTIASPLPEPLDIIERFIQQTGGRAAYETV